MNSLVEKISLSDVVRVPTEIKPEIKERISNTLNNGFDFQNRSSDFEPIPEPQVLETENYNPGSRIEVIEDYDAEKNARALVHTLQAIDSMVISGIGIAVNVKKAGGRSNISKLQQVAGKDFAGEELTAQEKKQLFKLREYERRMKMLDEALTPNHSKTEHLIQVATSYCEETQFSMGSGTAFWITYAGSLVEKVTKVAF
jgi:hypothetical protein